MISRLVLNLRSVLPDNTTEYYHPGSASSINFRRVTPDQTFLTRTIRNLGADMFVSGYTTGVAGDSDEMEVGIPLVNVSGRSEVSGNIP